MNPFQRLARFTVFRDGAFVALAASTLMLGLSFDLALAFLAGANIALGFALLMMLRASRLTEERIGRSEPWRTLPRRERPAGSAGRKVARRLLGDLWLQAAKNGAAAAIVLSILSLTVSGGGLATARQVAATSPAPQATVLH